MSALLRALSTLRSAPAVRGVAVSQRANVATKAAKDPIGPAETVFGLTLFALTILGPSGWILAHLESYKKRD
ncbi:cytochrome c oxidase subunit 8A, mitochondrial [Denticeps clupeoides]|uniref:Uncharacterized protein n=1 Tax=Denticeps clupeoides TaxID=299321 RepID=A0AAY4AG14_9TELE|nr:cytochrome c oxidase subunit 8B, mitochondrial-like [Denticeps clupeoides]